VLQPNQPQPHLQVRHRPPPAKLGRQRTEPKEEPTEKVSNQEQLEEEEVEVLKPHTVGPAPLPVPLEEVTRPQGPIIGQG